MAIPCSRSLVSLTSVAWVLTVACSSRPAGSEADEETGSDVSGAEGSGEAGGPETDGSGSAGDDGADSTPEEGSTTEESTTGADLDCDALCEEVLPRGCIDDEFMPCVPMCEMTVAGQNAEIQELFAECVATDPLCFSTIEMCIWSKIYPEPFPQTLVYTGTGYEEFEGATVYARAQLESDGEPAQAVQIEDGAFSVELDATLSVWDSRQVFFYVDLDDTPGCDNEVEFAASDLVPLGADFESPVFSGMGEKPETSNEFVCNSW